MPMALRPHWSHAARTLGRWLDPAWRRERRPERRAGAWAGLGLSLACYLFVCMWLGPTAGAAVTALYAFPCVLAGWSFGTSGGLMVGMLTTPVHAWLFDAGLINADPGGVAPFLGLVSAVVVGTSAGLARDLRERLTERGQELAASEDRYRQLVDNSPEGVLVHERGVIVFANPSMARLTGALDAKQLVGRTLVTLAPFEDREALAANFVHAMPEARGPRSIEARLAKADGSNLPVVMTTMPIQYRGSRANMVLMREASLVRTPSRLPAVTPARPVATHA